MQRRLKSAASINLAGGVEELRRGERCGVCFSVVFKENLEQRSRKITSALCLNCGSFTSSHLLTRNLMSVHFYCDLLLEKKNSQ